MSFYARYVKRSGDLILSATLLALLSPVLLVLGLLVWASLGTPVLFRQERPGLQERSFTLIKFRSMRIKNDSLGSPFPDDERLTGFGRFLRRSSLDELPELWNILKGEMSFVGPRPLLMEYVPLYSETQRRRMTVRPGLTGLAQASGRNLVSWQERFELDIAYIDSMSFTLDVSILWSTVRAVLSGKGVSASGHVTMPPFEGNPDHNRA